MPLTDAFCRKIKPIEKNKKYSDAGGLFLMVNTAGARYWRLAYSFAGSQKTLALGVYPEVSLAEAREAREAAKKLLKAGIDPSAVRKIEKLARAAAADHTFEVIAAELRAKLVKEGRADGTMERHDRLIGRAVEIIGKRPVADITTAEVLAVLRKTEGRGTHATAGKQRVAIGQVFRYAIATGRAGSDPTTALRGALTTPTVTPRAAIVDRKEFGGLLKAIWSYDGQPETRAALQLLALLYPRPGELRLARWQAFDLDEGFWIIPAEIAKTRKDHKKPLPPQAVAILRELHDLTGDGELLLPSIRSRKRPISDMTTNAALRRLGYAQDVASSHGFRSTASTLLNESGRWSADAIERELGHVEANEIRRAYHRADHWQERVKMAAWWGDYCERLFG